MFFNCHRFNICFLYYCLLLFNYYFCISFVFILF
jgi:hypothetical protein